ncbi:MAG: hydroxyacid dehydrogenase [Limisphaerales bacterium]
MDVLITEPANSPHIDRLSERYEVVNNPELFKDPNALKQAIADARSVILRNQTKLTADVLGAATNLRGIGRLGVGLDNIDVTKASEDGIVVVAPLNANAVSVAELAMGLMLSLARKLAAADRDTKAGGWNRKTFTGFELDGKTLAVCGFGRIGRMVATRAKAFGMNIVAFDPFVKTDDPGLKELGATLTDSVAGAVGCADIITVHMPLTDETKHVFNADMFRSMKPGAAFINTSRGGVVCEKDLVAALESGHLAGAGLDVRESEPPGKPSALESMDQVIVLPHIGAFTKEAQDRTYAAVASDLDRILQGESAENFVNFDRPNR